MMDESRAPGGPLGPTRAFERTIPGRQAIHPRLAAELAELGRDEHGEDSFRRFVARVNEHYQESEQLSSDLMDGMKGWSSFENLFRISPIPIMEQDYTQLEEWMKQLRARGVTSLADYLGRDIEAIRAIVPMIRIVAANPAAVRAVGISLEELIGPIDPRIVNEGSEQGWLSQLEAVWERRPVAHAAFSASTATGHTYDAESILSAPLIDGEPDFSRAVFTVMDVTVHRNEERRMEELVEVKNRFLASVSHEIRTPLTAILGFASVLDQDQDLADDERRLMVASIAEHAQEVADLVEDLLVAARADMGQIEVANTTFDLMDQVRQTIQAGGSFTTDVSISTDLDEAMAIGDPSRVRQIIRNLLTNAERYGGSEVSVVVGRQGEVIRVEVRDNGPGLPVAEWERIFEPYHRAHVSVSQPESVGIGLAISRQLAEMMGGTLSYGHAAGWSRFSLSLRAVTT